MKKDANYWNSKWEKREVLYNGRTLRNSTGIIKADARCFICPNDSMAQLVINKYGLKKATANETAHACQKFVTKYIRYVEDEKTSLVSEYWQFPFETIASSYGDCEDGAILMASLMINAGIEPYRVKVCAGIVQESPTAPQGGHGYCIFLADREDGTQEWEIHDWCYCEDTEIPTGSKVLAKDGGHEGMYKNVWWTFNNEYCWSDKEVEVSNRIRNIES